MAIWQTPAFRAVWQFGSSAIRQCGNMAIPYRARQVGFHNSMSSFLTVAIWQCHCVNRLSINSVSSIPCLSLDFINFSLNFINLAIQQQLSMPLAFVWQFCNLAIAIQQFSNAFRLFLFYNTQYRRRALRLCVTCKISKTIRSKIEG